MAEPRRLGRDPLEDLLTAGASTEPATPDAAPADPPRPRGKARITVQVDDELAEQVRDAVMWLHKVDVHTTISDIAADGLRAELQRLARTHRQGHAFPPRSRQVPTGRPPGN